MTGEGVDDDANGSERTGRGFGFDRRIMTMGGVGDCIRNLKNAPRDYLQERP